MTTVSILMPNYNHARYLDVALAGARNQTRPADEIIVLDDGSTDASMDIIGRCAAQDARIKVMRNDVNRGLQYSINRLLREARGDYIVSAAADDELLPEFLQESLGALARHAGAKICFSEFVVKQTDGAVVNYSRQMPDSFGFSGLPEFLPASALRTRMAKGYLWMSSNTAVVDRRALLAAGGFLPHLEWHSDWFAFYVVALRHGACLVQKGLSVIRANPGGYSDQGMKDRLRQRQVLKALIATIKSPDYRDLVPVMKRYPAILSVFGYEMLNALARNPGGWDLLLPYLRWALNHYRITHGLTWPQLPAALARHAAVRFAGLVRQDPAGR